MTRLTLTDATGKTFDLGEVEVTIDLRYRACSGESLAAPIHVQQQDRLDVPPTVEARPNVVGVLSIPLHAVRRPNPQPYPWPKPRRGR